MEAYRDVEPGGIIRDVEASDTPVNDGQDARDSAYLTPAYLLAF
jgi:hypothetical protein